MKKVIFTFALVCACMLAAQAQSYKTAVGLRLGYPASLSLKHFINEKGAVEGFLGFRGYSAYRWISVGAAYEHHSPIKEVENLSWYVGGGAAAFFWSWDDSFVDPGANTSIGVLAVGGLDYKFNELPLNVSVDWMPVFFINGYGSGFGGGYGALSARYTLK